MLNSHPRVKSYLRMIWKEFVLMALVFFIIGFSTMLVHEYGHWARAKELNQQAVFDFTGWYKMEGRVLHRPANKLSLYEENTLLWAGLNAQLVFSLFITGALIFRLIAVRKFDAWNRALLYAVFISLFTIYSFTNPSGLVEGEDMYRILYCTG